MEGLVRGVRPVDWVLVGTLTGLAIVLMLLNVLMTQDDALAAVASGELTHAPSSHSWWMLPLFLIGPASLLWWRRGPLGVLGVVLVVMTAHVLLFGWVTRCAIGLPLAFVLGFLVALLPSRQAWTGLGLGTILVAAVLVRDATTGLEPLPLALLVLVTVWGLGRAARHRAQLGAALRERNAELGQLRDERVALEVAGVRAQLSGHLDGALRGRLHELAQTAAAAASTPATQETTTQTLHSLEGDSRLALDEMRAVIGLLHGGDVSLGPSPTIAHLGALLARRRADVHLCVIGDPRALPASLELSAYRIVEHLLSVLGDDEAAPVEVIVGFDALALSIQVTGPTVRGADVSTAVAQATERARLHHGTLDVRLARGQARALASLPVLG